MDESRKSFEQWIASTTNSDLHRSVMLGRRESGAYIHLATENKWEAWQASRESMKPSGVCVMTVTNSTGEAISISDVIGLEIVEYKGA